MPRTADRVLQSSTTTGTGNFTLAEASVGFRTINSAIGVGPKIYYAIDTSNGGTEWEVGVGYLSDSTTLVREAVLSSSNSNALVSFSAGDKRVFCPMPEASRRAANYAVYQTGVL